MKNSIEKFKYRFEGAGGKAEFKRSADEYKKELTILLKDVGATEIKTRIGHYYINTTMKYKGREHSLSIGDYMVKKDANPYVLHTVYRFNETVMNTNMIPFQSEKEFVEALKKSLCGNDDET